MMTRAQASRILTAILLISGLRFSPPAHGAELLPKSGVDMLICGSAESEQVHNLVAARSETFKGALDELNCEHTTS